MSTLKELLAITPFPNRILITGPQRTGTTIAAKMIASEFGYPYIDENDIKIDDLDMFFYLHKHKDSYVMQAPGLSFICHRLPVDLVIFMQRYGGDIHASEARINWNNEWGGYESEKYLVITRAVWALKYEKWEAFQKPYMDRKRKPYFDLEYESLRDHSLWIDKEQRKNFTPRQTK